MISDSYFGSVGQPVGWLRWSTNCFPLKAAPTAAGLLPRRIQLPWLKDRDQTSHLKQKAAGDLPVGDKQPRAQGILLYSIGGDHGWGLSRCQGSYWIWSTTISLAISRRHISGPMGILPRSFVRWCLPSKTSCDSTPWFSRTISAGGCPMYHQCFTCWQLPWLQFPSDYRLGFYCGSRQTPNFFCCRTIHRSFRTQIACGICIRRNVLNLPEKSWCPWAKRWTFHVDMACFHHVFHLYPWATAQLMVTCIQGLQVSILNSLRVRDLSRQVFRRRQLGFGPMVMIAVE